MKLVELGTVLEMVKGKKPITQSDKQADGYLPYVDIEAFENGTIRHYTNGVKCTPCEDGDVLIVCDGTRSGLVGRAVKGYVGSTLAKIKADGLSDKYLFYFIQGKYALLNTKKKGTGTPHLNPDLLKQQKLLVPPLPEQERIIARIEELFSELDSGVETLKTVKDQLKVYRQAVLKYAFEGVYTARWRSENSEASPLHDLNSIKKSNPLYKDTSGDENGIHLEMPEQWLRVRIGDIFDVEVGSTPSRRIPEFWNGNIPWVSSGEVRFNSIFKTEERITQEGLDHASTNVQPVGTIMLAMIGEGKTRGQAAILNIPAAHNQNTAAILVSKTPCHPKYIYYFLQMNYENTRRVGSGNNQKALNKERVRALQLPFTTFAEQRMIAEEIESRLTVCDNIEKGVNIALVQAEALRQSILKKAFEEGSV